METSVGIIALVDALGISTLTIEESKAFINNRDKLLKELKRQQKSSVESFGDLNLKEPMVHGFGDTILLSWDFKDVDLANMDITRFLLIVSDWLGNAIRLGMHRQY